MKPTAAKDTLALLERLDNDIERCMLYSQHSLRREWHQTKERLRKGQPVSRTLAALERRVEASVAEANRRAAILPALEFPLALPVVERKDEIAALIDANQVCVICGETGSGKTTQLPKICMELNRGVRGMIGHTQPRRIAARTVAQRIADETRSELGASIGYKVRFSDHTGPDCHVKLMTDGILLAEIQEDRYLSRYDTLIIDEAHERSLNIDFLLGFLRGLLPRRPELKLIITSATIDPESFSRHFDEAPVLEVSGRTYPVEIRYAPELEDGVPAGSDPGLSILEAIKRLMAEESKHAGGDFLVFLAGEREIRDTSGLLRKHLKHMQVLPLFARLSGSEQNRVFGPGRARRIILATNVAETSLTVPGIRYVIDPGLARISRYSYRSKIQRLPIEAISQASAAQRSGRCGRVREGICVRLYEEQDFDSRPQYTEPEIKRTNLASVILKMQTLGLGRVEDFPFVEPPDRRFIKDGYRLLRELGAVDQDDKVTRLGRRLARFPVDPRVARMLVEADRRACLSELLVIAGGLSIQDPRERPMEKAETADAKHALFADNKSDFLSLLALWNAFHEQRRAQSASAVRRWCKTHFLSYVRMMEWQDVYRQLRTLAKESGLSFNTRRADYQAIHRAIIAGLLSHIGQRDEDAYAGPRNARFQIFPGSGVHAKPPRWLVAATLVQTSRLYARTVAGIEPDWIESAAGHLLNREYTEPHWQTSRGQVAAFERVTLFGLTLCAKRRVNYGPVSPEEAREVFIRSALLEGQIKSRAGFIAHNLRLRREVEEMEAKTRRRDKLVGTDVLFRFYEERIPRGIYSTAAFERWRKQAERDCPGLLRMTREMLLREDGQTPDELEFPATLKVGSNDLALRYRFAPGAEDDGVTLVVPASLVSELRSERLEWLVPGLLVEKVTAMIKGLPKSLRRNFVPAPEFATQAIAAISFAQGSLPGGLSQHLLRMTGTQVPTEIWQDMVLSDHLLMRLEVVDEDGTAVASGRSLDELSETTGVAPDPIGLSNEWSRTGLKDWDFPDLPGHLAVEHAGFTLTKYPAIRDAGDSVSLTLCDAEAEARGVSADGLVRLFMLRLPQQCQYLEKEAQGNRELGLLYQTIGKASELKEDLVWSSVRRTFLSEGLSTVRSGVDFERRLDERRAELVPTAQELMELTVTILAQARDVRAALESLDKPAWEEAAEDMRRQLGSLIYPGFIRAVPDKWLGHLPRYLAAITERVHKLKDGNLGDRTDVSALEDFRSRLLDHLEGERVSACSESAEEFRWLLEEFRVSIFAQRLGTSERVSRQRLKKRWEQVLIESSK